MPTNQRHTVPGRTSFTAASIPASSIRPSRLPGFLIPPGGTVPVRLGAAAAGPAGRPLCPIRASHKHYLLWRPRRAIHRIPGPPHVECSGPRRRSRRCPGFARCDACSRRLQNARKGCFSATSSPLCLDPSFPVLLSLDIGWAEAAW